jgi:hypothetical protein
MALSCVLLRSSAKGFSDKDAGSGATGCTSFEAGAWLSCGGKALLLDRRDVGVGELGEDSIPESEKGEGPIEVPALNGSLVTEGVETKVESNGEAILENVIGKV